MAEKNEKVEVAEPAVQKTITTYDANNRRKWWLIGGVGLGVVLAFMLGMLAANARNMNHARYSVPGFDGERVGKGSTMMRGGMQHDDRMRGGHGAYDSNTMVHGVVSAVSDSEMTIVGNGVSKKVTLTSSTTYGDSKPKLNDSVMARGTTSGETFTATSVQVVNR